MLLRDKALMKRRAQLGGIRVGIFEEAHDREDVIRFLRRVNQTLLKLDGDPNDPIHLKAFDKAGCLGHRVIRTPDEVDSIPDEEFPVLMESHLDGWEFAVEAWIHNGKIKFLNISEYVTLGYSVFVPATPELEKYREQITVQIEKLIKAFDIELGFIHPEYFVTSDGEMYFGESAYRPAGFKVFELLERAYGFNAYQGLALAFDPKTTEEEIDAFFPKEVVDATGHAGCFGVYPRRQRSRVPRGHRRRRLLRDQQSVGSRRRNRHHENGIRCPLGAAVIVRPDGVMRVYFFNPNNDSGQDWGDGVVVGTAGNGERAGEGSLPFDQFASRLYIFHTDPLENGEPEKIPAEDIETIVGYIERSWGAERSARAACQPFQE